MGKEGIMKCSVCMGEGGWYEDYGSAGYYLEDCYVCHGKGTHSFWYWIRCIFWEHVPIRFVEWHDTRLRNRSLDAVTKKYGNVIKDLSDPRDKYGVKK